MNEREWLQCTDLQAMLAHLSSQSSRLDGRKARLFACACCRLVWPLMHEQAWRKAVEVSEAFAEGKVSPRELARAWRLGWAAESPDSAGSAALYTASTSPSPATVAYLIQRAAWWSALRQAGGGEPPWSSEERVVGTRARRETEQRQCELLREIVGPASSPPRLDPRWRDANDGAVRQLASLVSRDDGFAHLPVLADALEEAGCYDLPLLEHLRRPGGHVLGCWAVDVVLGR